MKSSASASRFKPYRDVLVYSIPATTSLLIEMLTSLTDALFAGNLPVGGTEALSAITLASPVFGIAMALQSIFAMPVAVLVARHHRDRDERDRYLSLSIVLSIAVTLRSVGDHPARPRRHRRCAGGKGANSRDAPHLPRRAIAQ